MSMTKYVFPPQYNTVKDFDLYETCEYEIAEFTIQPFRKQYYTIQTKPSEVVGSYTIMEAYEQKTKKQRVQTSFHSKLLDQHIQSVEKHIFQYLEKSFPSFKTLPKHTLLWQIYGEDSDPSQSMEKLNELVKKDRIYFDEKHRNLFLTQLFYKESLYDFLALTCNGIYTQLAIELAFISSLFCQVHTEKQQKNLAEDQIQALVDEALESDHFSKELQKLEFLSLYRCRLPLQVDRQEIDQNLKKLIRVLGNTIILVIEEYFLNRFSNQAQNLQMVRKTFNFVDISNDEYSDDENEFHFSMGSKKRKA